MSSEYRVYEGLIAKNATNTQPKGGERGIDAEIMTL